MSYYVRYCSSCNVLLMDPDEVNYQSLNKKDRERLDKKGSLLGSETYVYCPVCKRVEIFITNSDLSDT